MKSKILLIEDNFEVRDNTAEILELANFEVITAENGKIGVEKAREELPDLIICDIMMPVLDGYGVLHILSKKKETAKIPFIFLTAKADKADFRKGMNLGADDYLTKPFEETELMDAIEVRIKKSAKINEKIGNSVEDLQSFMDGARDLAQLEFIKESRITKSYKKKEAIYRESDFANSVYFIKSGRVKTYRINDDGKEFITGLHKAGDFIGYLAVLEDKNRSECAIVLEDTSLALISKKELLELLYSNNEVAYKFIELLSGKLESKEQELIDLAFNTVRKRVADALLRLKKTYQETEEDGQFSISISRGDLAAIVGTAKESVIRILSEFKEDGVISVKGSEIKVKKTKVLQELKY